MSKRWFAEGVGRAGLLPFALELRSRTPSPWLPVICYHRFVAAGSVGRFDDGVADTTPETFDRQMSLLARWFTVLELKDLFAFRSGKLLPPNPVLVTFDDGYKDGFDVALPILRRHHIKATFFVATDYIDQRKLFWWDRIHLFVKSSQKESIELAYPSRLRFHLRTKGERSAAAARLIRMVKDERELDLERFIDGVSEACGASIGPDKERQMAEELLMTWDEVRALRAAGMDVQSHTRSHRTLQTVPPARLRDELGGSREVLERELGERVRAVAYPVGKRLGSAPTIRAAVRAAGYELGFSNDSGVNNVWTFDALDARRFSFDLNLPPAQFLATLAIPWLAS
jgi:peptidoglycan/xylan/chitin deacetylase (PgdA/CDA1 family)